MHCQRKAAIFHIVEANQTIFYVSNGKIKQLHHHYTIVGSYVFLINQSIN